MDVSLAIKQRLNELGIEQRDLARAAQVTESYISQLLTRRRMPPAPNRTDIYEKMDAVLQLPRGELAKLAAHQRMTHVKRALGEEPSPLFGEVRALILRKCHPARERAVRTVFEQQPFGELERLITTTVLNVVKRVARAEVGNELWLRSLAQATGKGFEEMRVVALEFLDTDILHVSPENCVVFLEPLVASWDIDLPTFGLEIVLNPVDEGEKSPRFHFHFTERAKDDGRARTKSGAPVRERGLSEFLADRALSGDATPEEVAWLETLRFNGRRPTKIYFYRAVQGLRDPVHFRAVS